MSISPIDAIGGTSTTPAGTGFENSPPTTDIGMSTAGLDREAFLKLLVAQLKYQDPTKPADTSQMLTQTAQLTMVDRINELAASFSESAATQRLSLAGTIVGRDISFVDPEGQPVTARVQSARFEDGALVLDTGQHVVPFEAVTAVMAPAEATSGRVLSTDAAARLAALTA